MGWATEHIGKLRRGEVVSFRPRGNSMSPRIESGQLCTVQPVDAAQIQSGDVVLCKVRGAEYLHIVKAIQGERFQIGTIVEESMVGLEPPVFLADLLKSNRDRTGRSKMNHLSKVTHPCDDFAARAGFALWGDALSAMKGGAIIVATAPLV